MTSGFVHGNGIDIHYRISGDGARTLVLVNGVGDDLDGWVNQVDGFDCQSCAWSATTTAGSAGPVRRRGRTPAPGWRRT